MGRYIGLDVHATSCTAAIVDARGKCLGHHVIETNGQVLVEFFKTQAGTLHVCQGEGTQATWMFELLSRTSTQSYFVIENNWGKDAGCGGYHTMSFAAFEYLATSLDTCHLTCLYGSNACEL